MRVEGVVAVEEYETPSQPAPAAGRTLTLLDGTQIKLPTPKTQREVPDVKTVRHIVKAIRGARTELASEAPLRWHDIVQAVLDALDGRGVRLTRQEIAEAWLRDQTRPPQGPMTLRSACREYFSARSSACLVRWFNGDSLELERALLPAS